MQDTIHSVSALICTRNRGATILPAVKSILHSDSICTRLIIIDQSTNTATRQALEPFLSDSRLLYISSTSEGKGHALNLGLTLADTDFVAITDDDCVVIECWPRYQVAALEANPNVAITYGNVLAADHDTNLGFIPAYWVEKDRLCRNITEKLPARGIGANTVVRRKVILELGGFDSMVGPGGKFRGGIDRDMTVRCLLAGHHICEVKKSIVVHSGFRNWEQGRQLTYDSWYGLGASSAKPLKCGLWNALPVGIYEFTINALFPFLGSALRLKKHAGWMRVRGFIEGFIAGWKTPVHTDRLIYMTDIDRINESKNEGVVIRSAKVA